MFHVCKDISGFDPVWTLENGLMVPQAHIGEGSIMTDLDPTELTIWLDEINGTIYQWQISVDNRTSGCPLAQYIFFDQTGDRYTLSAMTPYLHTVAYNSEKPFITRILIMPTFGPPGKWGEAPICATAPKVEEEKESK